MNHQPCGSENQNSEAATTTFAPDSAHPCSLVLQELTVMRGSQVIINRVSCRVPGGQTLVLVGESGCGKTTLLRAIAGLIPISSGKVTVNGTNPAVLPPAERRVLYLDQEPLLFEHLTVEENVAFPLRMQGLEKSAIQAHAAEILDATGMRVHAHKRPHQLSGGQKQRTAFARAVMARPRVLLLDEPFSALDAATRSAMQQLFLRLSSIHRLTCVLVTHDIREALAAGSEFCRMHAGQLLQYPDRQAFVSDEATGVREELQFWRSQLPAEMPLPPDSGHSLRKLDEQR